MSNHKEAVEEQIDVLKGLLDKEMDTLIMGDLNLDYWKRNDASYHLRRLYAEWSTFELSIPRKDRVRASENTDSS